MKKLLMISIAIFVIFVLFGCRHEEHDNGCDYDYDQAITDNNSEQQITSRVHVLSETLSFSSLEGFLTSYVEVKNGGLGRGEIDFQGDWFSPFHGVELADVIENIDFAGFEMLYIPTGIPDDFRLHEIRVFEEGVGFRYLHKNDMISEETIRAAISGQRHFWFVHTRWDMDNSFLFDAMMRQSFVSVGVNATEDDLINGRYFFNGMHSFNWVHDRERFTMTVPSPSRVPSVDFGAETTVNADGQTVFSNPAEMVRFLEIRTVDLTDPEQIEALLGELTPPPVLTTTIMQEEWRTTINIRFFLNGVLTAIPIEDIQLIADGVHVAEIRDFTVNVAGWQTETTAIFINKLAPPWQNMTVSITAYGQTLTHHFVNNMFVPPPAPTHVVIETMHGWDGMLRAWCWWCCYTGQLRATVHPLGADQTVVWSSDTPNVVRVDQSGFVSLDICCCACCCNGYCLWCCNTAVLIRATAVNGVSGTFWVIIDHGIPPRRGYEEPDPPLADDYPLD